MARKAESAPGTLSHFREIRALGDDALAAAAGVDLADVLALRDARPLSMRVSVRLADAFGLTDAELGAAVRLEVVRVAAARTTRLERQSVLKAKRAR